MKGPEADGVFGVVPVLLANSPGGTSQRQYISLRHRPHILWPCLAFTVRALSWHPDWEGLQGMGDRVGFSSCHTCSGSSPTMILMIWQNKDLNWVCPHPCCCQNYQTVASCPVFPKKLCWSQYFFFFSNTRFSPCPPPLNAIYYYDGIFASLKIFQAALRMWAVLVLNMSVWLYRFCCCAVHHIEQSSCILAEVLKPSFRPSPSVAVPGLPSVEMVAQVPRAFLRWNSPRSQWNCLQRGWWRPGGDILTQ